MKIGYGTYGMKALDIFDVLPGLKDIGFEMLEITAAPAWPTAPAKLSSEQRVRLRNNLQESGLGPAVVLCLAEPCVVGERRQAMLDEFEAVCRLATDIHYGSGPAIVTSTLGGPQPPWDTDKNAIAAYLTELAEIAGRHNCVYAIEPHVGGSFDRPEKANWLMRHTDHPHLRLNFDYSHFHIQGIDLEYSIDQCLPYSVHTHIKDGAMPEGRVQFTLPGDGNLDLTAYFKALVTRGSTLPVCVEVSGMVWNAPGYDPWLAAQRSFEALDRARSAATNGDHSHA